MSDTKILLPGQSPSTNDIIVPDKTVLVPPHVAAQRDEEIRQQQELAAAREAKNLMIRKSQQRLEALAAEVQAGKPLTKEVQQEASWLMRVATAEGNRKVRRMHMRRLKLHSSQAPVTKPIKTKPIQAEVAQAEVATT